MSDGENNQLYSKREEFKKASLTEEEIHKNPIEQFKNWYEEAYRSGQNEVNAMVVGSISEVGYPTSRVVYLRSLSEKGFVFFTNYESSKGKNFENSKYVSLNFFWSEFQRQVNVVGLISKISNEESDSYFENRPRGSQIGAWASNQSEVIPNREFLQEKVELYKKKFKNKDVPRPKKWGGYCVKPFEIEFWQGRESRLHDRLKYILENDLWRIERLSP